jgi:uncharacterized protein
LSTGPRPKLRQRSAGIFLTVRLTPKAARDEVTGIETLGSEAMVKARVRAIPEAGRANEALEKLIADWLDVPRTSVRVARGGKSRQKQVMIEGDPNALARIIEARLAELSG